MYRVCSRVYEPKQHHYVQVMTQLVDQMAQLRPLASRASVSVLNAAGGSDLRGGRKGLSALLGPVEAQLALSLFSLLPWLCAHFRYSLHTNLASLCILVRLRRAGKHTLHSDPHFTGWSSFLVASFGQSLFAMRANRTGSGFCYLGST